MRAVQTTDENAPGLSDPQWAATGEMPVCANFALNDHPLLEDVIPQIYQLAQHVGGLKRLGEIVAELERSQPE